MASYTPEEVSKHSTSTDLWFAIHGEVYDITSFLKEHPGGEEVLIDLAGQDATKCFDSVGHTEEAIQLKKRYHIGTLNGEFETSASRQPTVDDDDWVYEEPKREEDTSSFVIILGLGALVYAVLFYYMFL